jgi:hypothetical protein
MRLVVPWVVVFVGIGGCASADVQGLIAFAAGGSIYTVRPDGGELRQVVAGVRSDEHDWASGPALSPDGGSVAFVRGYSIWSVDLHSGAETLLVKAGGDTPTGGASSFAVGAQTVAWSQDGGHLAYVLSRIGGSGQSELWVSDADGSDGRLLRESGAAWIFPTWVDDGHLAIVDAANEVTVLDLDGSPVDIVRVDRVPANSIAHRLGERWLTGSALSPGPIRVSTPGNGQVVVSGFAPALSPGGEEIGYLAGNELMAAPVDGTSAGRSIVDLGGLGGADRHFASGCSGAACSYRPATLSWVVAD